MKCTYKNLKASQLGKDYQKDDIAVFLFTNGWDFVTSFYRNKDETPDEDEFDMM